MYLYHHVSGVRTREHGDGPDRVDRDPVTLRDPAPQLVSRDRPSRENANIIREAEVTEAIVQNNCATTAMKSRNSAQSCSSTSARCT